MNALKYVNDVYGAVIAFIVATVIWFAFSYTRPIIAWVATGTLLYQWRRYDMRNSQFHRSHLAV